MHLMYPKYEIWQKNFIDIINLGIVKIKTVGFLKSEKNTLQIKFDYCLNTNYLILTNYINNVTKLFSNLTDTGITQISLIQKSGYLIKSENKNILNELVIKIRENKNN